MFQRRSFYLLLSLGLVAGCHEASTTPTGVNTAVTGAAPARVPRSAEEMHAALKAKNPNYDGTAEMEINGESIVALDLRAKGVTDLSPLRGLPLQALFAEENAITDLTPLAGIRLEVLSLNDTPVENIEPLRGMPIRELRLVNTKVRDLSPLRGMPLEALWVTNAPVRDASPLAGSTIVSLTLEGTQVPDLGFVKQLSYLQRLHIGQTPVTDLSPLAGLPLTRLVFTPANITAGIEAARTLPRCQEFGVRFNDGSDLMRPPQFWAAYDAGAFK